MPAHLEARIRKAQRDLDLPEVDYDGTMAAKLGIARELFDRQGREDLQVVSLLQVTWMLSFAARQTCFYFLSTELNKSILLMNIFSMGTSSFYHAKQYVYLNWPTQHQSLVPALSPPCVAVVLVAAILHQSLCLCC